MAGGGESNDDALALPSTRVSEGVVRTARQAAIGAARVRGAGDRVWIQAIDEAASLLVKAEADRGRG